MPVVMLGSLNERIVFVPGLPFCAVVLAHLSISVSLTGRPWPVFDNDVSVFVMLILRKGSIGPKPWRRLR